MRQPGQVIVGSRRVDHDEIEGALDVGQCVGEAGKLDGFVLIKLAGRAGGNAEVGRHLEAAAATLGPVAPILHIMGEGLLPRVDVKGRDPLPKIHQGDAKVHRQGRFAGTALFVADHDDMRGHRSPRAHLHQHATYRYGRPQDEAALVLCRLTDWKPNSGDCHCNAYCPGGVARTERWRSARMRWMSSPPCPFPLSTGDGRVISSLSSAGIAASARISTAADLPATSESMGEFSPSSATATRTTSEATSLMRSRNTALAMRSEAQVVSTCFFIDSR